MNKLADIRQKLLKGERPVDLVIKGYARSSVYFVLKKIRQARDDEVSELRRRKEILKLKQEIADMEDEEAEETKKAYTKGYADAEALYKVIYSCNVCHKPVAVTTTEGKESCRKHLQDVGWRHHECHVQHPLKV